jgi:hypothetical protein
MVAADLRLEAFPRKGRGYYYFLTQIRVKSHLPQLGIALMPRDDELDRLRTEMNGAWEAMQYAKQEHDNAWDESQRLQDRYGDRIKSLKDQHDRMYQEMGQAFSDASSAFSRGDHEEAARCSARGRELKAAMAELPPQWRSMIAELQPAQARWKAARDVYRDKKHEFQLAKERFDDHKAEIEGARRDAALRAEVPAHYGHDVKVVNEPDGSTSIYFGGIGEPDGEGHGHYVLDQFGNITHRREPFQPHRREDRR